MRNGKLLNQVSLLVVCLLPTEMDIPDAVNDHYKCRGCRVGQTGLLNAVGCDLGQECQSLSSVESNISENAHIVEGEVDIPEHEEDSCNKQHKDRLSVSLPVHYRARGARRKSRSHENEGYSQEPEVKETHDASRPSESDFW